MSELEPTEAEWAARDREQEEYEKWLGEVPKIIRDDHRFDGSCGTCPIEDDCPVPNCPDNPCACPWEDLAH